jgi:two-component system, NtrC family, sensor kinase
MMLSEIEEKDVEAFGRALMYEKRQNLSSFESAAQHVVTKLHASLVHNSGSPLFALVRIFRICRTNELPINISPDSEEASSYWVTLMATAGDEAWWNNRMQSKGHQAIPERLARQSPMLRAVFQQIGLKWGEKAADAMHTERTDQVMTRYFYIPQALDSPFIADQSTFVKPYNIRSVVGFGGSFVSGSGYVLVGFAKEFFDQPLVDRFVLISPFVGTLLGSFETNQLWNEQ